MGNKQAGATNRMMDQSFNSYNQQRGDLQNQFSSGLQGAQGRSDAAFNAALQGYQGLIGQNSGFASDAMNAARANAAQAGQGIMGIGGPGNPWAGQLGRDIRARENSVLPAMYDRIREEQTRLQNLQGGYNPGYTAQMSKLSRDQARGMGENILNTEVMLGEKSAAAQAAQAQFALQQQAMAGAARGRAMGAGHSAASGFGRNSMEALRGIYNLRGQTPGEVAMYGQLGLGNLGGGQQGALAALGQKAQYNPNQSGWQTALGALGGLAGAAAPWANMFGGPKPPQQPAYHGGYGGWR